MKRLILLLVFIVPALWATPCSAKEWRGIFPLKTTRAEALKVLGEPVKKWKTGGEYFEVEDGRATIEWTRPGCFPPAPLAENAIESDSLVYRISFVPKDPLPNDSIKKIESELMPPPGIFMVYDGNCIRGGGAYSCNMMSVKYGFGYSNSKDGVSGLYYFPTSQEIAEWKEKLIDCPDR